MLPRRWPGLHRCIKQRITSLLVGGYLLAVMSTAGQGAESMSLARELVEKSRTVAQAEVDLWQHEFRWQELRASHLAALHALGHASWQELAKSTTDLARQAARATAAAGLAEDIATLARLTPSAGKTSDDAAFPGDVCVLVLESVPVQVGVCVLESGHSEIILRSVELREHLTSLLRQDSPEDSLLKSRLHMATERLVLLERLSNETAARNERTRATLEIGILEANVARQRAIAELRSVEHFSVQQCLQRAREQTAELDAVRLVLVGVGRNALSVAQSLDANIRLLADQTGLQQMATSSPAADPKETLRQLTGKSAAALRNASVVKAIIRLRQGWWEVWAARAEADAQAKFAREREAKVLLLVGDSFTTEKQRASLDRELAEHEAQAAQAALDTWDQTYARMASVWSADDSLPSKAVGSTRPPVATEHRSLHEFLQSADSLIGLEAPMPDSELVAQHGRKLQRQAAYLDSLASEGHVTPLQVAETRLRAQTAEAASVQFRRQVCGIQCEIEFLRYLAMTVLRESRPCD
jgi:hypothetical protein